MAARALDARITVEAAKPVHDALRRQFVAAFASDYVQRPVGFAPQRFKSIDCRFGWWNVSASVTTLRNTSTNGEYAGDLTATVQDCGVEESTLAHCLSLQMMRQLCAYSIRANFFTANISSTPVYGHFQPAVYDSN